MPLRRFGRPGLIGLAARTAVVAGTAQAVQGAAARHQQRGVAAAHEQAQFEAARAQARATPPAPPAPAPAATGDVVAQLQQLAALREAGALTDEEFAAAKARVVG
ncbi:SHOCT domain-containing protein [Microbacterium excoecariae]|uniref:SHOCT domain-containing protein n=1 Tax=Microbacterium excoecariae TaxID=2715210 RepID=UPI00140E6DC2|nr:SHOCT domain-containing protein [Microbacterium excoecariae]NHI17147.1 SHOCT domain-containing protein [Microbacterium excoecariae]